MAHEVDSYTYCNALGIIPKEVVKGIENLKIKSQAETFQTTTL